MHLVCLLALSQTVFSANDRPTPPPEDSIYSWDYIQNQLKHESAVTYRDGKEPLGAFFQDVHRRYLPLDSMPPLLAKAVIAAEDQRFYNHGGVDYSALMSAIASNVTGFSLKRGASTITQQTAKNVYSKPSKHKLQRLMQKGPEMVAAFKLEKYLTKNQILEIYLNQFFVSGNGRGAAIAAQFFFNQPLDKLELLELAFIAGSVKGPNQYNPFTAPNPKIRDEKIQKSHDRARYVLRRMYEDKYIDKKTYEKEIARTLPFKKGDFRFSLSNPLTLVQKELEKKQIQKILDEYEVGDIYEAGLKIVTTMDHDIQIRSEIALQKQLSRLDRVLLGDQIPPNNFQVSRTGTLRAGEYLVGRICSLVVVKGLPEKAQVSFGVAKGWVEKAELNAWLEDLHYNQKGIERPLSPDFLKQQFKTRLKVGAPVECIVLWPKKNVSSLALVQKARIQGSLQVLHHGEILAHVGGFENQGYDRVAQARRQLGSTFKPFVYTAALELGWHPLDSLDNRPQVFQMGDTYYSPRALHDSPDFVSMAWACRNSDNIASVWLTYHLFDKKSMGDFWTTTRQINAHPDDFDTDEQFVRFVQDSLGFNLGDQRWEELVYQKVRRQIIHALNEKGNVAEAQWLQYLPYGRGWEKEIKKYNPTHSNDNSTMYAQYSNSFTQLMSKLHSETLEPQLKNQLSTQQIHILEELNQKFQQQLSAEGPSYTTENLWESSEFRCLMGLRYTIALCRKLGIKSRLEPVLSFPLGANSISLGEATVAFSRMITGKEWNSRKLGGEPTIISKILLADGTVIYQDKTESKNSVTDRVRWGISSMLREVVRSGTAFKVSRELGINHRGQWMSLPALGKTGTTNDYRNSVFIGSIPLPRKGSSQFSLEEAATIGIYVGFDRNESMKKHGFRGFGGTTTLPPWIEVGDAIRERMKIGSFLDMDSPDLIGRSEFGLEEAVGLDEVFYVQKESGLLPAKNTWSSLMSFFKIQHPSSDSTGNYPFHTLSR